MLSTEDELVLTSCRPLSSRLTRTRIVSLLEYRLIARFAA